MCCFIFLGPTGRVNDLDGVGGFAFRYLPKGTVLFQHPTGFIFREQVQLSQHDISNRVGNIEALNFLEKRIVCTVDKEGGFFFDVPFEGAHGMNPSFYVCHAKKGAKYNVELSTEEDFQGFLAMITSRDVKPGEELMLEYDKEIGKRMRLSKKFFNDLRGNEENLEKAKKLGSQDVYDKSAAALIDNLNQTCVKIAPSNINGIGVFVAPGCAEFARRGMEPCKRTKGSKSYGTMDLTDGEVIDNMTCEMAKIWITRHCTLFFDTDRIWKCAVPGCGPNGIDSSFYTNSRKGTALPCNIKTVHGLDDRGLGRMVLQCDLKAGD